MEVAKIGDPWSILPIKNALYAKECTEVDLTGRNLEGLQCFEQFPNIEAVFLNNNRLQDLNALHRNTRLKRIFCSNNQLTDIEAVKNFKFLEVLLVSNNQLKDLDKLLLTLSKLSFLEQLTLNDNPVAEEPRYRLRIIKQMPKLKILDRHAITVEERMKAEKLDTIKVGLQKKAAPSQTKKRVLVSEAFSQAEKELYREVEKIKGEREEEKRAKREAERRANMPKEYVGMPETQLISGLRKKASESYANRLTDAEMDDIEEFFRKMDTKNSGAIATEDLKAAIAKLKEDTCNIGKVPFFRDEADIEGFIAKLQGEEEEPGATIKLPKLLKLINKEVQWEFLDPEEIQRRVDQYYAEAKRQMMMNKKEEALNYATKAMHLAGTKDRSRAIEATGRREKQPKSRKDVVSFKMPVQKSDEAKIIRTVVNGTQVVTRTKYDFPSMAKSLGEPRHIPIK